MHRVRPSARMAFGAASIRRIAGLLPVHDVRGDGQNDLCVGTALRYVGNTPIFCIKRFTVSQAMPSTRSSLLPYRITRLQ